MSALRKSSSSNDDEIDVVDNDGTDLGDGDEKSSDSDSSNSEESVVIDNEKEREADQLRNMLDSIERTGEPSIPEIEKLFTHGNEKIIINNLHNLILACAGATVSRASTTTKDELGKDIKTEYLYIYHGATKMSMWKEKFFVLLPREFNNDWPPKFKDYVETTIIKNNDTEINHAKVG